MQELEFTIESSAKYAELKPGNYNCIFMGITPIETTKGKAWRWEFKREDNSEIISGLTDANGPPTPANKTGRWLSALANKPLTSGEKIIPANYVGKRYLVIVQADGNGKASIITFTALWS